MVVEVVVVEEKGQTADGISVIHAGSRRTGTVTLLALYSQASMSFNVMHRCDVYLGRLSWIHRS